MSQMLANWFLQNHFEKERREHLDRQVNLKAYHDRIQEAKRQDEADFKRQQIEQRSTLYSNYFTRRADMLNAHALSPLAKALQSQFEYITRVHHAKDSLFSPSKEAFNYEYSTYYKLSALGSDNAFRLMATVFVATHALLECTDVAPGLHFHSVCLADTIRLNGSCVSDLLKSFTVIAERSANAQFSLFWGMPQNHEQLRTSSGVEGALFSAFCPADSAMNDDLCRMREMLWLCRFEDMTVNCAFEANNNLADIYTEQRDVEVNVLLDQNFNQEAAITLMRPGIELMFKKWSGHKLTESEEFSVCKFYDQMPIAYLTCSAWLLYLRINPNSASNLLKTIVSTSHERKHYETVLPTQYFVEALGLDNFFPETKGAMFNRGFLTCMDKGVSYSMVQSKDSNIDQGSSIRLDRKFFPQMGKLILEAHDPLSAPKIGALGKYCVSKPMSQSVESNDELLASMEQLFVKEPNNEI